jgi:hypothetical protein
MRYLFRSPVFPILFKVGPGAVCAESAKELDSYLKRNGAQMERECAVIDSRWEGWVLYPKDSTVSPLAFKKGYTKRDFLLFCGMSEEQLAITNLNKYSREQIFDFVLQESRGASGRTDATKGNGQSSS